MRILVVDNGGQWTHREWRVLRDLGIETAIVPNTSPPESIDAHGIVLSGGSPRVGLDGEAMGLCGEYMDKLGIPVLGICAGHQHMAIHFGGEAAPSATPEFGKTLVNLVDEDVLFKGFPKKFVAWESHHDEITVLPKEFRLLASSDTCKVQAMRHNTRPLFGLQFHPEVEHTENGHEIFQAFLDVCRSNEEG
ncbi:MAG: GMP synthase subunit A [Methanobacteriota archaeon]|nr:MAG: GMP synthase subunit A [Euryarchaeota archaeon]